MKRFMALFYALLAIAVMSAIATGAGANFYVAFGVIFALTLVPVANGQSVLNAGLNQEIWSDIMVKQFRLTEEANFLNEIPDESRWVQASRNGNNEIIHAVDVGADPDVLINNTTYPIPYQAQVDGDLTFSLDKYQTKVTPVTDDEIKSISYDKVKLVQEKHTKSVMKVKHRKALHALTPAGNTAATPVLKTTGPDDGSGRKRLIYKDIARLKTQCDDAGLPEEDRVLVLCSDHMNDLIWEGIDSNGAKEALSNLIGGKVNMVLFGFKIYWFINAPYIKPTTLVKLAFGAVPVAGDQKASVLFVADECFKAMGSTKQYSKQPEPSTQQWEYNVRHYYVVLPKKQRAIAAIVSDNV